MFATRLPISAIAAAILLTFAPLASAQDAAIDPPNRVVRLAYQSGDVQFAPAGDSNWGATDVNRPLITGDRLETGQDGRVALELGDASVRINDDSAFNVLSIDSNVAQFELSQGTLDMRVRQFGSGQTYEVDTSTVAFVAGEPGNYRIDIAPDGNGSTVTVFSGSGTVYGENGVSRPVASGRTYRFDDSQLSSVTVSRLPQRRDAFDRFGDDRDARYDRSISRRYVSADVIGYDDLDGYGDWRSSSDYGEVWYPNQVARNWAPYHDGHWAWVDPWGWTWIDNAPWGFAPSHYGRWAYVDNRWGWVPGGYQERAVYAPALVAFIGGSNFSISLGGGEPVGWFPLGPRDVYQPPYRVTRNYFTNVNVTNVNTRVVNNTVINNTYNNYITNNRSASVTYNNRSVPGAVTVVPRSVFTGARPVAVAALRINPQDLARAKVTPILRVPPTLASLSVRPGNRPAGVPAQRFTGGPIIARHAPPAPAVPFAERLQAIDKQGGAPLARAQLRELRQARATELHAPPRVVMATQGGGKINPAGRPGNVVVPGVRPAGALPPTAGTTIRPHPNQAGMPLRPNPIAAPVVVPRDAPARPGELPSARFAHPRADAPLAHPLPNQAGAPTELNRNTGIVSPRLRTETTVPADKSRLSPPQPMRNPQLDHSQPAQQAGDRGVVHAPRANGPLPAADHPAGEPQRLQRAEPRIAPMPKAELSGDSQRSQTPRAQEQQPPTLREPPVQRREPPMSQDVRVPRAQERPVIPVRPIQRAEPQLQPQRPVMAPRPQVQAPPPQRVERPVQEPKGKNKKDVKDAKKAKETKDEQDPQQH